MHEKKFSTKLYSIVQCRTKIELKTMNQIPKSPLRVSSLGVVHRTPKIYALADQRTSKVQKLICYDSGMWMKFKVYNRGGEVLFEKCDEKHQKRNILLKIF